MRDIGLAPHLGALLLLAGLGGAGCAGIPFHSSEGVTHHLIIGIGVVSTKEQPGVSVEDAKVLGLMIGRGGFNAGIGQQHNVEIDPETASNVIISIRATPFCLTVTNFSLHDTSRIIGTNTEERKADQ